MAAQTADVSVSQQSPFSYLRLRVNESVTVTATNHGTAATNVRLTYSSSGGYPTSASGAGWFCDAASGYQVVCGYDNLASGAASPPLWVVVKPTLLGARKFVSRAEIVSTLAATDANTSNNVHQHAWDVRYETYTRVAVIAPAPLVTGREVTVHARVGHHLNGEVSTGSVALKHGITPVGTAAVVGGLATFVLPSVAFGNHTFTAQYLGTEHFNTSSHQATATARHPAGVSVTSSVNPSTYGTGSRFTATVTSPSGTPTGYVSFYKANIKVARRLLSTGTASWDMPPLYTPSTADVRAVYEGNASYAPAESAIQQVINKAPATVALTTSDASADYGQLVTLTARVTGTGSTPAGSVALLRNGVTFATVALLDGVATYRGYLLPTGSVQFTAQYLGSRNHEPATSTAVAQDIAKAVSSTTLSSSLNPAVYGQGVSYTATVASGQLPVSGYVRFYVNSNLVATRRLPSGASSATATYSVPLPPAGAYAVQAVYLGAGDLSGSSSATLAQTVEKSVTTTTLSSSANPSLRGASVTFTAAVTPSHGTVPRGTVTFRSGNTVLRVVALSAGSAAYSTATLPTGTHAITATYGGSVNMEPSASSGVSQAVQRAVNATITAVPALCPSSPGHTASVLPQSGVTYQWSIRNGTITSATNTSRITFTTGLPGPTTLTATVSCGTCATATDTHSISVGSALGVSSRDLTGDDTNDLVWQNRSTGATQIWAMSGTVVAAVVAISAPPSGWLVESIIDVNSDGRRDLIYRNTQTGAAMVWLMDGTIHIGSMSFAAPAGVEWQLGGVADFNCDGQADVVWRNNTTGENAIWMMAGNELMFIVPLRPIAASWRIAGVGDFNTNGRADIVWRNTTDGTTAVWTLNATTLVSVLYPPAQPDLAWSLSAVADFNRDGRPDLVWRNATTGANEIWLMYGTKRTSIVSLPVVADGEARIGGPR